jgi:C-terminal processing protease CtpA/Prc
VANLALVPPLPPAQVETGAVTSPRGKRCGLLRLHTFSTNADPNLLSNIDAAFAALAATDALVIDLRGNGGGSTSAATRLLGHLLTSHQDAFHILAAVGDTTPKKTIATDPIAPVYTNPVIVLTDGGCFSACSLTARLLHELGRATIVGEATGGGNGSPKLVTINSDFSFTVPNEVVTTPSGVLDELSGFPPDVAIAATRADIAAGLYAALGTPSGDVVLSDALATVDAL